MIRYFANRQIAIEDLLPLYQSVSWTNSTERADMLEQAFQHSLFTVSAYDGEQLVGLLRAVGDGFSSVFIQDLLVFPSYQRRGIGRELVRKTLETFADVYQIQLITEQSDKNLAFYRSLGFRELSDLNCTGLIYRGKSY